MITKHTPPKLANKLDAQNAARKRRELLEDFANYAGVSKELVDLFLESYCG
ncbi:hypothetical protein [Mycolicibacterium phlei]|uniref:hypothetical protein n=1 Tax=Mycolicibacterium phlei TaxID=1771 RepID=UPI0002EA5DD9|nr:hypothetical protein [Mycolicibacterium phlei]